MDSTPGLSPDTLIPTPRGFLTASKEPHLVYDGLAFKKAEYYRYTEQMCMEVTTAHGHSFCGTFAHQVLSPEPPNWVRLEDLRVGRLLKMRVGLPLAKHPPANKFRFKTRKKTINFKNITPEAAFCLGYFATDRWDSKSGVVRPVFPDEAYRDEFFDKIGELTGSKHLKTGNLPFSGALYGVLSKFGFHANGVRKKPDWLYGCPRNAVVAFLDSLRRAASNNWVDQKILEVCHFLLLTLGAVCFKNLPWGPSAESVLASPHPDSRWESAEVADIRYVGHRDVVGVSTESGWHVTGPGFVSKNDVCQ